MDRHALKFFKPFSEGDAEGAFHEVVPLHERKEISWEYAHRQWPMLSKGWYELAHLTSEARIALTFDFWCGKLPFCPHIIERTRAFFDKVDDIGIFLTQKKAEDPFIPVMVYSLTGDGGFFRGFSPSKESEILSLQESFSETILPEDYLGFMSIHNGFAKVSDSGVFSLREVVKNYQSFPSSFTGERVILTPSGQSVDPSSLIPFYQSFSMPFYQCFWTEWHPETLMGNVYFSGSSDTICVDLDSPAAEEKMAFATFFEWLAFYLESVV